MDGRVLEEDSSTGVLVIVSMESTCHICILQWPELGTYICYATF